MSAVAAGTAVKFQVSLNVTDLARSIRFYRILLNREASRVQRERVFFDVDDPPLVLGLIQQKQAPAGSLNHVGFRLPDSAALVDVQRRLGEAGFATQTQEGVECCYARQTKFWATDPDGNLWELYVFEDDIEHSGFEDAPRPAAAPTANPVVWRHTLLEPVPARIPREDGAVDEVHLEGSFNAALDTLNPTVFLAEIARVLRPGGKVAIHGMASPVPLTTTPKLPGLAALAQRVPAIAEVIDALAAAGFVDIFLETLHVISCLQVAGVELCEIVVEARRPVTSEAGDRQVLYKGPLAQVTDEAGVVYPRGQAVSVTRGTEQQLRQGIAAGQFAFFPVT